MTDHREPDPGRAEQVAGGEGPPDEQLVREDDTIIGQAFRWSLLGPRAFGSVVGPSGF